MSGTRRGTSTSRSSSVTACSEIASITRSASPQRLIIGATPEVDSVILRRDTAMPSGSMTIFSALATFA